jgi:MFS family permease
VLVGLTEAAIMTCCTTLLADYFSGATRERYFGLQVVFTTVAATVFFGLGGALGSQSWRTPFWLYVVSLPLAAAAARYVWQPAVRHSDGGKLPSLPWRRLAGPVGTSLVGGVVFYVLIVELSFKLDSIGVHATGTIGAVSAISSLGTAVGAFVFGRVAGRGPRVTVPLAFALSGVGLVALGLVSSLPLVVVTAVVAGLGNGLLLPGLLSWAVGGLTFEQRGRGTGFWTAALFLGEFVCPLVVNGLHSGSGSLGTAIAVLGGVAVVAALVVGGRLRTSAR